MAEPLKTFFSPALVRRLAGEVVRAHPTCALIQEGGVNAQIDILLGCKTKPAEIK